MRDFRTLVLFMNLCISAKALDLPHRIFCEDIPEFSRNLTFGVSYPSEYLKCSLSTEQYPESVHFPGYDTWKLMAFSLFFHYVQHSFSGYHTLESWHFPKNETRKLNTFRVSPWKVSTFQGIILGKCSLSAQHIQRKGFYTAKSVYFLFLTLVKQGKHCFITKYDLGLLFLPQACKEIFKAKGYLKTIIFSLSVHLIPESKSKFENTSPKWRTKAKLFHGMNLYCLHIHARNPEF